MSNMLNPLPRGVVCTLALLTGGLLLAGCAGASEPEATETTEIRGALTVPTVHEVVGNTIVVEPTCESAPGYDDVRKGGQVAVLDPEGTIVAIGELGEGKPGTGNDCTFPFVVPDVPLGEKFYSIDVGNEFRGIHTIPEDKLGVYQTLSIG
ncbi:hypothetical protein ACEYYH_12170 [Microbacterium trichothecenolyticum]|uniref:hypothetical protein n=1 Tax=Microbacterium trichothecenolyticum TaxID=69370 RepID=UPI0035BE590C